MIEPDRTPPARVSTLNVANLLTGLRMVLVPVFLWLLLREDGRETAWRLAAGAVFVVAGLTDRLDGELARRRGLVTDFGKIADPIADKALTGAALIALSVLGELPWWVTWVIIVRELGITVLRLVLVRRMVLPAGRGGKAKTAVQLLALTLYILPLPDAVHPVAVVAMAVAVLLTVVTGIDYLIKIVRQLRATSG